MRITLLYVLVLMYATNSAGAADCDQLTRAFAVNDSIFNDVAEQFPENHPAYLKAKQDAAAAFRLFEANGCDKRPGESAWTIYVVPGKKPVTTAETKK